MSWWGGVFDGVFLERLSDSIKHEDLFLKDYGTTGEVTVGLAEYFTFYNDERPHWSLSDYTANFAYRLASADGTLFIGNSGGTGGESPLERGGGSDSPPAKARPTIRPAEIPAQRRLCARGVKCTA